MKRGADGSVSYRSDCAVATFVEVTGARYDEAVEVMRAVGYRPGQGTPSQGILSALTSLGWSAVKTSVRIEDAERASRNGRVFIVYGRKGSKAHSWSILNGTANRPYHP